jgi:hypothetical protein
MRRLGIGSIGTMPIARITGLIVLALAQATILARHFPAPIISDEVKFLLIARHLGSGADLQGREAALAGWPFAIWAFGLLWGGIASLTPEQGFWLACAINTGCVVAIGLCSYGTLRLFDIGPSRAMVGAITVLTMPIFVVWTQTAMYEVFASALICAFVFCVAYILKRGPHALAYVGLFVVCALYVATKAVAPVSIAAASLVIAASLRDRRSIIILAIVALTIAANLGLVERYNYEGAGPLLRVWHNIRDVNTWGLLPLAAVASLAYSLLAVSLLPPGRGDRVAWTLFAAVTILLLSLTAISVIFHASVRLFTNYRQVISAEPAFVLMLLALALPSYETRPSSRWRAAAVVALFASLIALTAWKLYDTNVFDWMTMLPLRDYVSTQIFVDPRRGLLMLVAVGTIAVATILFARPGFAVYALIALNLSLSVYFRLHPWSQDPWGRDAGYRANLDVARQVIASGKPILLLLQSTAPWAWSGHAYPYLWAAVDRTRIGPLNPGFSGIVVSQQPVLEGQDPIFTAKSPTGSFYAYVRP